MDDKSATYVSRFIYHATLRISVFMALNLAEHCLRLLLRTIRNFGKFPLRMTTVMIIINNTKKNVKKKR